MTDSLSEAARIVGRTLALHDELNKTVKGYELRCKTCEHTEPANPPDGAATSARAGPPATARRCCSSGQRMAKPMPEPREAYRLAYEALLHANHLLYLLPHDAEVKPIHAMVDDALRELAREAQEWGVDVDWMHNPPVSSHSRTAGKEGT